MAHATTDRHEFAGVGNLTLDLASYIAGLRYGDLPAEVAAKAKACILDALGCCLFGVTRPWTRMIIDMVAEQGGAPQATVPGSNFRTSVSQAALIGSTAGHGFELDDIHVVAHLHCGSLCVPVALAIGEWRRLDGRALIAAIVAGYEAGLRIGLAATGSLFMRGFHFQGTCGAFAAAATAAHALGLDAGQTRHALAIAGSQAAGLMAAQEGGMVKRMHCGRAAQSGLYGALLAARGFTGIANVLEAPYGGFLSSHTDTAMPKRATENLGKHWRTLEVGYKPYASAASTHTALYALASIMRENDLRADDIAKIGLRCSTMAYRHCAWPYTPQGVTTAQMSLFYTLAVMAHDGEVLTEQFDDARLADPALVDFMRRIKIEIDPVFDAGGDATRHEVRMALATRDGRRFENYSKYRKGSPENPMSRDERYTKFKRLSGLLAPRAIEQVIREVEALEDAPDLSKLIALLRP